MWYDAEKNNENIQGGIDVHLTFKRGGQEMIDLAEPLWKELNQHHRQLATHHKEHYDHLTFAMRKEMILRQAVPGKVMVETITGDARAMLGYCISLVDHNQRGEIASIYIAPEWRSRRLGRTLMENALTWMKAEGAKDTMVTVLPENSKALEFYRQFGFFERLILMLRPESVK